MSFFVQGDPKGVPSFDTCAANAADFPKQGQLADAKGLLAIVVETAKWLALGKSCRPHRVTTASSTRNGVEQPWSTVALRTPYISDAATPPAPSLNWHFKHRAKQGKIRHHEQQKASHVSLLVVSNMLTWIGPLMKCRTRTLRWRSLLR